MASVKHGRPGFNWTTRYNYAWAKAARGALVGGNRPLRGCACNAVNDVGERLAGEPHELFEGEGLDTGRT